MHPVFVNDNDGEGDTSWLRAVRLNGQTFRQELVYLTSQEIIGLAIISLLQVSHS